MKLESIACNHCGAPLQVGEEAKFVTCRHCHTQLAITRTESAVFTEEIERLSQATDRLEDEVAHLRYENALEKLDRDWEQERERFMIRDKYGNKHEPTFFKASLYAAIAVLGGIFLLSVALSVSGGEFSLVAFVVCAIIFFIAFTMYRKAQAYNVAQAQYERERAALSVDQFRPAGGDED